MSRIYVDRISPYQSGSVQVDGLSFDTGSLVTTASFNAFTASAATTGSNTFVGNQVVTGTDKQTYSAPGNNQQIDNITVSGVTIGGTSYNLATLGYQNYGGAFENVFVAEQADSVNFNYYGSMATNGKGWSYNISPSGSGGTISSIRLRETDNAQTKITAFANEVELSALTGDLLLKSLSGSVQITGSVDVLGSTTSTFDAPAQNVEIPFVNVNGATIGGRVYNRVYFGIADYSQFGPAFEDYFGIEYYDSFSYNYGSELNVNGRQIQLTTLASGSGQTSYVRTTDNYDGTSQVSIGSGNKVAINGKAELSNVLQLAPQDPLPGGDPGQLAVSGSSLYFYTDQWREVAFV